MLNPVLFFGNAKYVKSHSNVELAPRRLALACASEAGLVARAKGIDFGWKSDFEQSVEDYVLKFGSTGTKCD